MGDELTHIDANNQPKMVDVSDKATTTRVAIAECVVQLPDNIKAKFQDGEIQSKKGPVFHAATEAPVNASISTPVLALILHSQ